jgi:murein DD-endopeptidase MepM/ murein hydrolase activator NlpD
MGGTISRLSAIRQLVVPALCLALSAAAAGAPLRLTAPATILQPGSVLLLTIAGDDPVSAVRVRAFNRELAPFPVNDRTWQVLIGIDLDVKPGAYPVEVSTGASAAPATYTLTVKPRRFPTRTLRVNPDLVNPPPQEMERIAREAARLRGLWEAPPGARIWAGPFVRPVPDEANSSFGTRSIYNGQPRSPHGGTDFLSPTGRPIAAPNAGRVLIAEPLYFTGGTVVLDHGLGVRSLFAHLSSIAVREGDVV